MALLALVVWPLVWLVSQPLALLGIGVEVVFVFLKSIFTYPPEFLATHPSDENRIAKIQSYMDEALSYYKPVKK